MFAKNNRFSNVTINAAFTFFSVHYKQSWKRFWKMMLWWRRRSETRLTLVRQCWYTQTSWIFILFQLKFLRLIKQHKMSALSKTNSKKFNIHHRMITIVIITEIHITIVATWFHVSFMHITGDTLLVLPLQHQLKPYFGKTIAFVMLSFVLLSKPIHTHMRIQFISGHIKWWFFDMCR